MTPRMLAEKLRDRRFIQYFSKSLENLSVDGPAFSIKDCGLGPRDTCEPFVTVRLQFAWSKARSLRVIRIVVLDFGMAVEAKWNAVRQ